MAVVEFTTNFRVIHLSLSRDFLERQPLRTQQHNRALWVIEFVNFQTLFEEGFDLGGVIQGAMR